MRRKRKRRGDLAIDLTSLLDVIFIVLLVVICYASGLSDSAIEREAEAEAMINEANESKKVYNQMTEVTNSLTDYVGVIVIRIPPDENNYKKRSVLVLENGEQEIQNYQLIGNDTVDEQQQLYEFLDGYISDHDERPVIISLNDRDEDILYRDEKAMLDIISKLKESHNNIYIK